MIVAIERTGGGIVHTVIGLYCVVEGCLFLALLKITSGMSLLVVNLELVYTVFIFVFTKNTVFIFIKNVYGGDE